MVVTRQPTYDALRILMLLDLSIDWTGMCVIDGEIAREFDQGEGRVSQVERECRGVRKGNAQVA